MASVDLLFAATPGTADLLFGAGETGPLATIDGQLVATLPAIRFSARVVPSATGALVAAFPALTMAAIARYTSNTARPTVGSRATVWQRADEVEVGAEEGNESTARTRTLALAAWEVGLPATARIEARPGRGSTRTRIGNGIAHQDALRASPGGVAEGFRDSRRTRFSRNSTFQDGDRSRQVQRAARYQDGLRDRHPAFQSRYARARRHAGRRQFEAIQGGMWLRRWLRSWWQNGVVPPPGVHPGTVVPPVHPPCYTPSPHLLFVALAATDGHLLFCCERGEINPAIVVPIRRVYCVLNNVILRRVVDGTEVPALSLSLALDATSWTWGFEAMLPATALALVDPDNASGPVELLASINGTEFRVLAEGISRERSFGEASIRISGRGRNALLAAPYAPVMTFANTESRTAQQLLNDVLTHNGTPTGIPLGWAVDWGLTNWTVPAGVFNHQGTWIEALNAIVGAAGGYLIPHRSAQSLTVSHRYPVAPWAWNTVTPDFVLPVDAVARESLTWQEKPAYNRVFVSGQEVGVLAQVTRAGTAGDLLAPMVVDPLITEAAAARQRGMAVLADTGRQIAVNLRLPVLAETGVIEPGAFIEYQDGSVTRLGLVRSTQVQAGLPEVWQTLGVEAHV